MICYMALKMIFLDSSFLIAIEVENDENHEKARDIVLKIISGDFGEIVISDYVFDETLTVTLLKTKDLKKAILVGENLKVSSKIIRVEEDVFDMSWNIFKEQKNNKLSFTDCTNIAIMRINKIKNIATFDKDFKGIEGINVVS